MVNNVVVISHRKDADGISSAALVRYASGADVLLTDYGEVVETLASVGEYKDYFICDLGSNQKTFDGFLEQARRFSKHGKVHYVDHHPISDDRLARLTTEGIDVTHSIEECASVLVYRKLEEKLRDSPQMKILACCGAITDYMDNRTFAKKLISSFDRQFLLYEATVLSFMISVIGRDQVKGTAKLVDLAEELAEGKLPHEINGASDLAQEQAKNSAELLKLAKTQGKKMKNCAYFLTKESSTGNVANFLIGAFEVPVGVAFRDDDPDHYEVSLRSTEESKHDLGKIIGKITSKLDASGGGHPHASGARIKKSQLQEFLSQLDNELS